MTASLRILPLVLAVGCAPTDVFVRGGPGINAAKVGAIGVLPAVVVHQLPGALDPGVEPFFGGLYTGHVQHSGGVVLDDEAEGGSPARSKEFTLSLQDEYIVTATQWTDQLVGEVLTERKLSWSPLPAPAIDALPLPALRPTRGSNELDGADNVNLPRYTIEPGPLANPSALGGGAAAYLVPYVAVYYSHNGGWFVGQRWGCASGARIRVFTVLYDAATGAPLTWRDSEARDIEPYIASPNQAELEDRLIAAEALISADLHKHLLR